MINFLNYCLFFLFVFEWILVESCFNHYCLVHDCDFNLYYYHFLFHYCHLYGHYHNHLHANSPANCQSFCGPIDLLLNVLVFFGLLFLELDSHVNLLSFHQIGCLYFLHFHYFHHFQDLHSFSYHFFYLLWSFVWYLYH